MCGCSQKEADSHTKLIFRSKCPQEIWLRRLVAQALPQISRRTLCETRFPIISNAPRTPLHTMYDERSAGAPGQPADAAKSLAGICYEKLALYESPLLSANNRTLRKLSFLFVFCSLSSERAARVRKNCTNQLNLGRVHYGKDPKDLSQTATR